MNCPETLSILRHELVQQLLRHEPPVPHPLDISPWLAMALLQKAIRRGHGQFALQAAATLLRQSPERFWRRACSIAFEDVGVADIDTVGLVTASLAGKSFRAKIGGEWSVASYLVERMCDAPKCRSADDLLMLAERHPSYEHLRLGLTYGTTSELLAFVRSSAPLPKRALAAWYLAGTDRCASPQLRTRKGTPQALFDDLCEAGHPHTLVEIAREGFRRAGQVLCPLVVLLASLKPEQPAVIEDDDFPPEAMCGVLPSWALDVYSREGQQALRRFLGRNCNTARWVRSHVSPAQRIKFLGDILFAVEGGLLRTHYRWPLADELRRLWEIESQGSHCPNATEIISLLRNDIPLLNEERQHV
ncbi:MAG: hypothetical protein E5V92_02785 [Mesorhizobium sp.]|uniref:hypothetical protein n=1 Tax=unclassified Mesorhizobium TaxID=325217 RepID=UPI000F750508|nr:MULTISPECIES: hypothetical protein [unclassified Mesorhizobium]AZO72163.1 hypothetical protein EJ067_14160 [Mesorhizobium sp. M1D.F.Ca.ET.043.01.1.1]RWA94946.1 MAG: hypothetical protein EOQ32_10700 [Mesorhizobium sp.]RWE17657.1 MAG: hypothetical protein EOS61_02230 [Mesorhizobium sp.]TJW89850.1 MAG: hypothetical protein E5V92_02785 [Mesorhizobium sp.]